MTAKPNIKLTTVAVLSDKQPDDEKTVALVQKLSVDCISPDVIREYNFVLSFGEQGLMLLCNRPKFEIPFMLDFDKQRATGGGRDPLKKALAKCNTVVDATAGWGADARRLCDLGFSVSMVERNPVVAAMLEDALERSDTYKNCLKLLSGDSIAVVKSQTPDAVYMDTMYPDGRKKGAKVKKPLQILRALCGDDNDEEKLLNSALSSATKRVVVKRPHFAPELKSRADFAIESKLVRYDVYLV